MKNQGIGKKVTIYLGESDKSGMKLLYEAITLKARSMSLSGATVLKAVMGFGAKSHLHTSKILRLSEDLPMVIEIIDTQEKIEEFLPEVEVMIDEAKCGVLITVEDVEIHRYSS
jgi:uncharacterized protein